MTEVNEEKRRKDQSANDFCNVEAMKDEVATKDGVLVALLPQKAGNTWRAQNKTRAGDLPNIYL